MVLAAKGDGASAARAELCATHRRPLYTYIRLCGRSVEDAQDLTQSFFSLPLEKDYLRRVGRPSASSARSSRLCLKNFLTNDWRHEHARKRGGGVHLVTIEDMARAEDHYATGFATAQTPQRVYERNWALVLLEQITAR